MWTSSAASKRAQQCHYLECAAHAHEREFDPRDALRKIFLSATVTHTTHKIYLPQCARCFVPHIVNLNFIRQGKTCKIENLHKSNVFFALLQNRVFCCCVVQSWCERPVKLLCGGVCVCLLFAISIIIIIIIFTSIVVFFNWIIFMKWLNIYHARALRLSE